MSSCDSEHKPFLVQVFDNLCIGQYISKFPHTKKFRCFQPQETIKYNGFCDDFGPMNLSSIARFADLLDNELISSPAINIVYSVEAGRRAMTNAVFLVGAYMMLKREMSTESVVSTFDWLKRDCVEDYRDATFSLVDFGLTLKDCWGGLELAMAFDWVRHPSKSKSGLWGMVDVGEYAHWDDPLNGDFHMVVPDKLIAFKGPHDLQGREYSDDEGHRKFSPSYYVDIFRDLGVTTVVRLNEPEYDQAVFVAEGINHFDLCFADCTSPSVNIVERFFEIVDAATGVVAIHCKAGLGRTGTLIALYLMRSCGFSAREAMGWLRIMRPGSVLGEQQHYLCAVERDGATSTGAAPAVLPRAPYVHPTVLAAQVAGAVQRRCAVVAPAKDLNHNARIAAVAISDLPTVASTN
jgi:cell division cycle 14